MPDTRRAYPSDLSDAEWALLKPLRGGAYRPHLYTCLYLHPSLLLMGRGEHTSWFFTSSLSEQGSSCATLRNGPMSLQSIVG